MTAVTTTSATTASIATTAMTSTTSAAGPSPAARATISATIAASVARAGRSVNAIEVWLVTFFELGAAFERQRANGHAVRIHLRRSRRFTGRDRSAPAHFCPLLFEDGLA